MNPVELQDAQCHSNFFHHPVSSAGILPIPKQEKKKKKKDSSLATLPNLIKNQVLEKALPHPPLQLGAPMILYFCVCLLTIAV